jgi:hypothetical protein
VASIALAAMLFLFVLPSRTYLAQRHSLSAAATRLRVFSDQNAKLAASADRLQTDAEIERLARQQYGLVKPGEKAYVIVPSPGAGTGAGAGAGASATSPAPPSGKKAPKAGVITRVWHDIQFWN